MIPFHEYDTEDRLSYGSPSIPTSSIVKRFRLLFTTGHSNFKISTVYAHPFPRPPPTSPDNLTCSEPSSASYNSSRKQYRPNISSAGLLLLLTLPLPPSPISPLYFPLYLG